MRYLRLLSNAIVAGLIGAAYLTVLLLQINPDLPLSGRIVGEWYLALATLYAVHIAVLCYLTMMLLELTGLPVSAPAWISVRLQAWITSVACAAAAVLTWLNLNGLSQAIGEDAARHMTAGAVGTSGVAAVLLMIAIIYYSVGRRGSRAAAAVLALAIVTSLALPIAARGFGAERTLPGTPLTVSLDGTSPSPAASATDPDGGRVVIVALEGASLEYIWPRAAEGRFPNIGRILDRGAAMDLATLQPTQPEPVWTAVATGKYPPKNGVASGASYYVRSRDHMVGLLPDYCLAHALVRFGVVRAEPRSAASVRARPIWNILSARGLSSGIVRWPLTYPVRPVRGFIISDRVHLVSSSLLRFTDESIAYPDDLLDEIRLAFSSPHAIPEIAPVPENASGGGLETLQELPLRWDTIYGNLARELSDQSHPRLFAVRYTGLDAMAHAYLRYATPRAFGDVTEAEVRRFGGVVDRYYSFIDGEIGTEMETLGPDDLLLVGSGFGIDPMSVPKRLLARVLGDARMSGTHERAPDGFVLAYGAHVHSGKLPRGAVVDIAPTILYYLGLPVGRDMDGYARTDLFDHTFTDDRPIVFIPSYDR
ncbi:MAG TPA: alkaline phosphatase family protein [Gemmatimonadaceae bacterium]|nr:alkaline phosphatase family protein [Gemmatimonadaceae bacterium]